VIVLHLFSNNPLQRMLTFLFWMFLLFVLGYTFYTLSILAQLFFPS